MPVCRDASLWRSKIWRLSLLHYPPPPLPRMSEWQRTPLPARAQIDSAAKWLRTLYEVLHGVYTFKFPFHGRNNLCQWPNMCKNVPETVQWIKQKLEFCEENGLNLKHKNRRAQKSILSGRFGDPYERAGREGGRSVPYPGELRDNPERLLEVSLPKRWIALRQRTNHYPAESISGSKALSTG